MNAVSNPGGSASLAGRSWVPLRRKVSSITPIAFDTDGLTDLAISGTGLIQFLQSKGDGTFDFPDSLSGDGFVTSADLNRDGLLDLIGTIGPGGAVQFVLARSKGGFDSF